MAHYGKRTKKEQLHTDTAFKAICCRILKEKLKGKFTHGEQALLWKQDCWAQPQQFGIKVSILCRRDLRLLSCKRCRDYRMAAQQRKAMLWHDLLPVAISAKGSAQPITALPGGLSRCVGAQPQVSPCPRLCWEKCQGQSHLTLAAKVTCLLYHVSKTWKGEVTSGKMVPQAKEQENSCDLRTRLSILLIPCFMSCPSNEMKGT